MNDNNAIPLTIAALYCEPFLNYLSFEELANLRQVNRAFYLSLRLKNKLWLKGVQRIHMLINIKNSNNPREIIEKSRREMFDRLIGYHPYQAMNQGQQKAIIKQLHSLYVFSGGKASYELISRQAENHRGLDLQIALKLAMFTIPLATFLAVLLPLAILVTPIPAVGAVFLSLAALFIAIVIIAVVAKNAWSAHERKNYYAEIEKADNPIPVIPMKRNFSLCFKGLFFKGQSAPEKNVPLISENKSCDAEAPYVTKAL